MGADGKLAWKPLVLQTPVMVVLLLGAGGLVFLSSVFSRGSDTATSPSPKKRMVFYDTAPPEGVTVLPESSISRKQLNLQVKDSAGTVIDCFRKNCTNELTECQGDETCHVAMRHFFRNCWSDVEPLCNELITAGLLKQCPASFEKFYSCYDQRCNFQKAPPMSQHQAFFEKARESPEKLKEIIQTLDALEVEHGHWAIATEGGDPHMLDGHRVSYNVSMFAERLPGLLEQFLRYAEGADRQQDWGVWAQLRDAEVASPSVRCVQLHEYSPPGEIMQESNKTVPDWVKQQLEIDQRSEGNFSYAWHCDESSLVTMAIVLEADEDFEGGAFTQRANHPCGPEVVYNLAPGDVLVWESWRNHVLMPVIRGRRKVLLVEFWEHKNVNQQEFSARTNAMKTSFVERPEQDAWRSNRRWTLQHVLNEPVG